jgi:F-type H+-transporting ATPase subunit epsilon
MAIRQDASTGKLVKDDTPLKEDEFHLKIYSPFKVYFEGIVTSVSALNETGPFDVLAKHHNFITLLLPSPIKIVTASKREQVITISKGIMQVKSNDVIVCLDV